MLPGMGQPAYTGDDGRTYRDPCTSKNGRLKKRWATADAAWYVVELASMGLYTVAKRRRLVLYAYECPKCGGWHTASAGNDPEKRERHRIGLETWREKTRK